MIPKQLQEGKFKFILLKEKIPIEKDWTTANNYSYNDEKIIKFLDKNNTYGIVTGYGNLIVLDFDNPEFQNKIEPQLPKTFTIKTAGKGLHHKYYFIDNPESFKILDINKNTLMDGQGKGKQVVAPNSIINNKKYEIIDDIPINNITKIELSNILKPYINIDKQIEKENQKEKDTDCQDIKRKISIPDLLQSFGIDTSQNPTECPLHSSVKGKCLSFNNDVWYCFHCEKKGNIFHLLMEKDNMSFIDAKSKLASMAGITLQEKKKFLKIDNFQDNVEKFWVNNPFFYDKNKIFWFWNSCQTCYELIDETELMNLIDEELGFLGQTITGGLRNNYLEAFRRVGRKHIPMDAPTRWIQFKKRVISLRSGKEYEAMPNYFFTNPIPWDVGETEDTPTINKLFTEWVGETNKTTLYEILAYCCYREYPIQVLFCFCGIGRNGKTQFLKLLAKFLGENNVCNTDLDLIAGNNRSRFETFKLYKKLAGIMGETNFGILASSSLLKRLTGGDMIGYEMKGKNPFDAYSYCKLLIASNSLPSSEDTSEGFYRRWIIIDFPNQFNEGTDIVNSIPEVEYCNLAKKVKRILPELLAKHSFTGQGDTEYRKMKYILASNPLPMFIKQFYVEDHLSWVRYSELYSSYISFLNTQKKRIVTKKEFSKVLTMEGYECRRTTKNGELDFYVEGLRLITPITPITENSQLETLYGELSGNFLKSRISMLFSYIENNDYADNFELIKDKFGEELIINELIKGNIFEFKPGWLKKA